MLRDMEPDTALDFDVVMQGTVYLDIVLTGLSALPSAGTEIPAEGMGSCPGGIAITSPGPTSASEPSSM
jgi:hypothetical protein